MSRRSKRKVRAAPQAGPSSSDRRRTRPAPQESAGSRLLHHNKWLITLAVTLFVVVGSIYVFLPGIPAWFPGSTQLSKESPPSKKIKMSSSENSDQTSMDTSSTSDDSTSSSSPGDSSCSDPQIDSDKSSCTATKNSHCRERYPLPPTNPKLPDDYEPLKTIEFSNNDRPTELFDPPPGSKGEQLLDFLADKIITMLARYYMVRPYNEDLERTDFTGEHADMGAVKYRAGNYIICDAGDEKIGRCSIFGDCKTQRYPDVHCARVISDRNAYPTELLDEFENEFIPELREFIRIEGEDLTTYEGMKQYQDETGLCPYFPKLLDQVIQYGCTKRGVCSNLHMNINEIALHHAFEMKNKPKLSIKNPMEMLHCNHMKIWKDAIDAIEEQGALHVSLVSQLMFNTDPQSYKWIAYPHFLHLASWAPNIGGLTAVNLEDDANEEPSQTNSLWKSIESIIRSNFPNNVGEMVKDISTLLEDNDLLAVDLSPDQLMSASDSVSQVINVVKNAMLQTEMSTASATATATAAVASMNGQLILIVTEWIYYCLTGKKRSFIDPLGQVEVGWDTSSVTQAMKNMAIGRMSEAIDALIRGVGSVVDGFLYIPYLYFDTNSVAFNGLAGAEELIRSKGYQPLGVPFGVVDDGETDFDGFEVGQMKVFWKW